MSRARVAVLKVVTKELSVTAAAAQYGYSASVYTDLPKAAPTGAGTPGHYRLRYDLLDKLGKMSLRRAGRMLGHAHARKRVLAIADDTTVTVIELATGEILSTHLIEPTKNYWRNQQKSPGRWPGHS